jgi:coenzyme F420-reducing hydrogenase gamma subunit
MPDTNNQTQSNTKKKLVVGWFSFTCCEDSTILFTELLNYHLDDWKKLVEFRHVKALKTKNSLKDLDVAFIEGAISSKKQEDEVKEIRANSKYVVAIGACACTGLPSGSRNEFTDDKLTEKIQWYMNNFDYSKKVLKLSDVIKVDDSVEGCPMNPNVFLETLYKYLQVLKVI